MIFSCDSSSIGRNVGLSVGRSVGRSVCRSVCRSVGRSVPNEFYRSVMLLVVYICCQQCIVQQYSSVQCILQQCLVVYSIVVQQQYSGIVYSIVVQQCLIVQYSSIVMYSIVVQQCTVYCIVVYSIAVYSVQYSSIVVVQQCIVVVSSVYMLLLSLQLRFQIILFCIVVVKIIRTFCCHILHFFSCDSSSIGHNVSLSVCLSAMSFMEVLCCCWCINIVTVVVVYDIRTFF